MIRFLKEFNGSVYYFLKNKLLVIMNRNFLDNKKKEDNSQFHFLNQNVKSMKTSNNI